jgi:hypothetical protein
MPECAYRPIWLAAEGRTGTTGSAHQSTGHAASIAPVHMAAGGDCSPASTANRWLLDRAVLDIEEQNPHRFAVAEPGGFVRRAQPTSDEPPQLVFRHDRCEV